MRLQALARAAAAEEAARLQKEQRRQQKEAELQQRSLELEELRALKRRQQQMRADYARWDGRVAAAVLHAPCSTCCHASSSF